LAIDSAWLLNAGKEESKGKEAGIFLVDNAMLLKMTHRQSPRRAESSDIQNPQTVAALG